MKHPTNYAERAGARQFWLDRRDHWHREHGMVEDALEILFTHKAHYTDQASYWFCRLDSRLLIYYLIDFFGRIATSRRWQCDVRSCPCKYCRSYTRRNQGNAWEGRPIQERKLIQSMEVFE